MPAVEIRRALLLLAAGGFVSALTMRLAEPLLPKVAHDFDVSIAAASAIITGYTLAYGLFQLVHGPLGDKIGKLRAVVGALMLAAVASAACAAAPSLPALSFFRFLTGMTAGAVIPLSFAFIGDNVPYERRQLVLGQFISGTMLGQAFGPLLGGVFSDYVGWRSTFLVAAAAFLLISLVLMREARTAPQVRRSNVSFNPVSRFTQLLKLGRVRVILAAVAIEGFLFFGAFAYLGAYLRHDFALSYTAIGLILAGFGVGGVVYSMLVRSFVRGLGQTGMVAAGGVSLLVCFVSLALTASWVAIALIVLALGLAFYMLHNTLQVHATEMAPEARGSAVSSFAFCLFLGQAAGVAALGLLVEWVGYRPVMLVVALGLVALALWFRQELPALQQPKAPGQG